MSKHTLPTFPIEKVRTQFPALKRTYKEKAVTYFDGPGGSQVVQGAIDAITAYMTCGGANLHGAFVSSRETEAHIEEAKQAVADLVGAHPEEVAFGANMTTLTFAISRALGRTWNAGEELVVTEMDHRANVDPWLTTAEDRGMNVRWIPVNAEQLTLDISNLNNLITEKTRLVAVGLASNAVGTINLDTYKAIAARAREVGALIAVDAVHAVPHFQVDRDELGADILLFSAYKFFGPHIGIAVVRGGLFAKLAPYKLQPAPSNYPDKLETGTQNHEGIPGITAAIEFIADLGEGATRPEKIQSGYEQLEAHEGALSARLRSELATVPGLTLYQAAPDVKKTPTVAFQIDGYTPRQVCEYMAEEHSIFIAEGHFYASTLADVTGVNRAGGWIRAGLAPYNTVEEVDRFVAALRQLVGSA